MRPIPWINIGVLILALYWGVVSDTKDESNTTWHTTPQSIDLATMTGFAPETIQYRCDEIEWSSGTELVISEDGYHIVEVRAKAPGDEILRDFAFDLYLDQTPPTISITALPAEHETTVSAFATDATSGLSRIQYRLNGGKWIDASQVVLKAGFYLVEMKATDAAGNSRKTARLIVVGTTQASILRQEQ